MVATMAGQKSDAGVFEGADNQRVRGVAKGGFDADFFNIREGVHLVQAAAADNADVCLGGHRDELLNAVDCNGLTRGLALLHEREAAWPGMEPRSRCFPSPAQRLKTNKLD